MTTLSDDVLLERLYVIVRRLATARAKLSDRDDLASDVFLRLVASDEKRAALLERLRDSPEITDLRLPLELFGYVSRVMENARVDAWRRYGKVVISDIDERTARLTPDPRDDHARTEWGVVLSEWTSAMKPGERAAVVNHFVRGYAAKEIARYLDDTVPAVKARTYRGINVLRERFAREFGTLR